jgi:hypothetical protein
MKANIEGRVDGGRVIGTAHGWRHVEASIIRSTRGVVCRCAEQPDKCGGYGWPVAAY